MATITGTNVNFVKVNTLVQYNDLTPKVDGTIYFVVDAKKIFLDGVGYGISDEDANQFLKIIGGEMHGNIDMGENEVENPARIRFGADNFAEGPQIYFDKVENKFKILGQEDGDGERAEIVFGLDSGLEIFSGDGPLLLGTNDARTFMHISAGEISLYGSNSPGGVTLSGLEEALQESPGDFAASLGWVRTNVINKIGVANGIAELDGNAKVPAAQLPSYVDDVLMFPNFAGFPTTGESGKIYVAEDTNRQYRWTGSGYIELYAGVVLGETSSTAYRGDRGKIAYDHTFLTDNPHGVTKAQVGLSAVQNYGVASEAQAKAGTVNNVYMTPLRTKQAIEELAPKLSWTVVS